VNGHAFFESNFLLNNVTGARGFPFYIRKQKINRISEVKALAGIHIKLSLPAGEWKFFVVADCV
jgi:hypothetical protein